MKKTMHLVTVLSLIGLSVSAVVYGLTKNRVFFSLAITFGTVFYHFAVRLIVGYFAGKKNYDHTEKWFTEKGFEKRLYSLLRVKKWKRRLPTYNPQDFDVKRRSVSEIVQTTCQSEVVHEINMVLSFVPVAFSIWFGSLGVFLLTSCAAFLFDCIFVIMQRYNRPRLVRLMKKS